MRVLCVVGCVVVLWILASCSSPIVERLSEDSADDDGAMIDSLAVAETDLLDAGSTVDSGEAALADIASEIAAPRQTGAKRERYMQGRTIADGLNYMATGVTGSRSEFRGRLGWRRSVTAGLRTGEFGSIGYFCLTGAGLVRRFHLGYLSVRMGERLIAGRRFGMYSTSGGGAVANGMAVSPSLSRWSGRMGAALEIGRAQWVCRAVLVSAPGGIELTDPSVLWLSVARRQGRHSFGATLGEPLARAGAASGGRPRVVSLQSVIHGRVAGGSGEVVASSSGRVFYAFRIRGRSRSGGWRWGFFWYRAPWVSSDLLSDLRVAAKTHQGTRFDGALGVSPGVRLFGSVLSGQLWSCDKRISYRRFLAGVRNRGHNPVSWEVSVYNRTQNETRFPTSPVVSGHVNKSTGDFRFRGKLRVETGTRLWCQMRLDYLPPLSGIDKGTVLLLGVGLSSSRVDARLQAVGHSLPRGRAAYITRPGVGTFELFSGLYGEGSDLSVRLRWRVGWGTSLVFFHGSSGAGSRAYLGVECRR